jgi:hypothetical protein
MAYPEKAFSGFTLSALSLQLSAKKSKTVIIHSDPSGLELKRLYRFRRSHKQRLDRIYRAVLIPETSNSL